jgi:hypothetical protein
MAKDDLETGIAAGLDVPTAMVISERDDGEPSQQPTAMAKGWAVLVGILLALTATILYLLR